MEKPDWLPELWWNARQSLAHFDSDCVGYFDDAGAWTNYDDDGAAERYYYDGKPIWWVIDKLLADARLALPWQRGAQAVEASAAAKPMRVRINGIVHDDVTLTALHIARDQLERLEKDFLRATELTDWTDAATRKLGEKIKDAADELVRLLRQVAREGNGVTLPAPMIAELMAVLDEAGVAPADLRVWSEPPPNRAPWDEGHPHDTDAHRPVVLLVRQLQGLSRGADAWGKARAPVSHQSAAPMRSYFLRLFGNSLFLSMEKHWVALVRGVAIPMADVLLPLPGNRVNSIESIQKDLDREVRKPLDDLRERIAGLPMEERLTLMGEVLDRLDIGGPEPDTNA